MPQPDTKHTPPRVVGLWPIYVPSKGRPESSTVRLLAASGVDCHVVVEPQDFPKYKIPLACEAMVKRCLPRDNEGIAAVRNWILQDARERGLRFFWMLDDDIKSFHLVENQRLGRPADPAEVLREAQRAICRLPAIGQAALEYGQFAWSARKEIAYGYCDVAVAINVAATQNLWYRKEMDLKEDRDFTLQILTSGWMTARSTRTAFVAPKNGSNKGGLFEEYAKSGREAQASQRMVEAWPGICSLQTKKDGRPDVKIDWRRFTPKNR